MAVFLHDCTKFGILCVLRRRTREQQPRWASACTCPPPTTWQRVNIPLHFPVSHAPAQFIIIATATAAVCLPPMGTLTPRSPPSVSLRAHFQFLGDDDQEKERSVCSASSGTGMLHSKAVRPPQLKATPPAPGISPRRSFLAH